jgi:hypothetical protein
VLVPPPTVVQHAARHIPENPPIPVDDLDVPTFLRRQVQKAGA